MTSPSNTLDKQRKLETLLSSGLNREATHGNESDKNQRPGSKYGCIRIHSPSVDCNDGRTQTGEPVEERCDPSACTPWITISALVLPVWERGGPFIGP